MSVKKAIQTPLFAGTEQPPSGSGEITEKTVSTTDPDCGMFVKGDHL